MPECLHIYSHNLQIGSSWVVDMKPYGLDDNFVFALKNNPGIFVFRSDTQKVIQLSGIDECCFTRKISCASRRIAQIDSNRVAHFYLQDDIDDEAFVAESALSFHVTHTFNYR